MGSIKGVLAALGALVITGAPSLSAQANDLLPYCLNQIEGVGAPADAPLTRHRQFGQLVLLQDQLKYLAQQTDDEALGRCSLMLSRALAEYRPQPLLDPTQLALEAQLRHLEQRDLKRLTIGAARCWQGFPEGTPTELDLSEPAVSRYLNLAEDTLCRERVWVAYQNRGYPDAQPVLEAHRQLSDQLARHQGFASDAHRQLDGTPLSSPEEVAQFLAQLTVEGDRLPWAARPPQTALDASSDKLAWEALHYLVALYGLTLAPISDNQMQLWEGERLLGYLTLEGAERHRVVSPQGHWIGLSPALVTLEYREGPWYPRHWVQYLAQLSETLVQMAGQPLPYQGPVLAGGGYGFGRALARQPQVQNALLGHTLTPRPLFPAARLYQAQMALAVASQARLDAVLLAEHSHRWFAQYFGRPAPKDLKPWFSHSDWAIAGARDYLPLWHAHQGQNWAQQWAEDALSGAQIWRDLTTWAPKPRAPKVPAELTAGVN
ncbi:M3 family metallopeptidase [Ferrimonas balearica]|uniref:M3 family metallopeptidase n=1 Tax=Ferrimonas balearica TaxID=44012 RepID=UPI001C998201|nr:M3 family metallopeptidase [Ferrimonas balearica]MBY5991719.1 hypothetical protein [Ferrimonas balearica]